MIKNSYDGSRIKKINEVNNVLPETTLACVLGMHKNCKNEHVFKDRCKCLCHGR